MLQLFLLLMELMQRPEWLDSRPKGNMMFSIIYFIRFMTSDEFQDTKIAVITYLPWDVITLQKKLALLLSR